MSDGFVKIYESILQSTIWLESPEIKVVWFTMLALKDQEGIVHASIPGLAKTAGVSVEDCETALKKFLSPDPYSRTKDFEGRRIQERDGGWFLINHAKYRDQRTKKQIDDAERQARHRSSQSVTACHAPSQRIAIDPDPDPDPDPEKQTTSKDVVDASGKKKKKTNPNIDIIITCFNETGKLLGWTPFKPSVRSTRINTILANRAADPEFMANLPKYAKMMQAQTWTEGWSIENFLRPRNMEKCFGGFWDKNKQESTQEDIDLSKPWNQPDYDPKQPMREAQ